ELGFGTSISVVALRHGHADHVPDRSTTFIPPFRPPESLGGQAAHMPVNISPDLFWILVSAALVVLMQGGFCLLEAGAARAKNSTDVTIKSLIDFCISGLAFWIAAIGLMLGASRSGFVGTTNFERDLVAQAPGVGISFVCAFAGAWLALKLLDRF